MFDLITLGDIKLDVFIDLGNEAKVACSKNKKDCTINLKYGKKIPVASAVTMMAGSAPNMAIGARKLGVTTSIISVVGDDTTATLAIDGLRRVGIPTNFVEVVPGTQSSFSAVLNFEGESTVLAVHRPHEYHLPNPLRARWLFVTELGPNYRELFQEVARDAREDGVQIALNPGAIQLEENDRTLHELLEQTSLLVVNKDEARELCGCDLDDPRPLLRTLQEMGPKIIVITDGVHGAWATEDSVIYFAPAFPGKRVEATGAGDAFSTGVIAALILEKPLDVALAWGSVNAASVVQYVGPHAGLLVRESLEKRLRDMPDYHVKGI